MVREHGFKGAVINGHNRGRYLDDKFFWPILERAESLGAPIYLHPTQPPKPVIEASYGGFSSMVTDMLAGPGLGGISKLQFMLFASFSAEYLTGILNCKS